MISYSLRMWYDGECEEWDTVEAETIEEARVIADGIADSWIREGDWGIEGGEIYCRWAFVDDDGEEIERGGVNVTIEPDHDALIRLVGGDTSCDHEWESTYEVEGGCRENPGVWSHGGTAFTFKDHCVYCGLRRTYTDPGSQRNPGESDRWSYELP